MHDFIVLHTRCTLFIRLPLLNAHTCTPYSHTHLHTHTVPLVNSVVQWIVVSSSSPMRKRVWLVVSQGNSMGDSSRSMTANSALSWFWTIPVLSLWTTAKGVKSSLLQAKEGIYIHVHVCTFGYQAGYTYMLVDMEQCIVQKNGSNGTCWPLLFYRVGRWWKGVMGQQNSCKTLIGVQSTMHLMHPINYYVETCIVQAR